MALPISGIRGELSEVSSDEYGGVGIWPGDVDGRSFVAFAARYGSKSMPTSVGILYLISGASGTVESRVILMRWLGFS